MNYGYGETGAESGATPVVCHRLPSRFAHSPDWMKLAQ
jgi:hypothetical protein